MDDKTKNLIRIKYLVATKKILSEKYIDKISIIYNELLKTNTSYITYVIPVNKKFIKIHKQYKNNIGFNILDSFDKPNCYIVNNICFKSIDDIDNNIIIKKYKNEFIIPNNTNVLGTWTLKYMLDNYKLTNYSVKEYRGSLLNDILKLFNEPLKFGNNMIDSYNMYYIDGVMEGVDNIRYARLRGKHYDRLLIISPDNEAYNFIDDKRIIYYTGYTDGTIIAFDLLDDINQLETTIKNYNRFRRKLDIYDKVHYNNDDVLSVAMKVKMEEAKEAKKIAIAKKVNEKYKESLNNMDKSPFIRNGIAFSKHYMVYENIKIDTNKLFDFSRYLYDTDINDIADFNDIYEEVITAIVSKWVFKGDSIPGNFIKNRYSIKTRYLSSNIDWDKDISLYLNSFNIKLSRQNNLTYINDIRINKKEIIDCLLHILCHTKIETYLTFLKSVSKCSLKFHNAITKGITKKFKIDNNKTNIVLKVKRVKNKNFLLVGKKEYTIKNSNSLIDTFNNRNSYNLPYYEDILLLLLNTTTIDIKQLPSLIEEGMKRYNDAIKKSKKLLDKTIKMFDVKEKSFDGNSGYIVNGKSGKKYWIQDREENNNHDQYKIWELNRDGTKNNSGYRCIVDQASEQTGKDALCSRIFALANDTLVAKNISTLKV